MEDIIEYLNEKLNGFEYKKLIIPTIILLIYVAGFTYLYNQIDKTKKETKKDLLIVEETKKNTGEIYQR